MLMYTENFYSSEQIRADIAFLKYQLKRNCKTTLIAGTGLSKIIEDCELYLSETNIYLDKIRAVHILSTLINSIKLLWFNDIDFCQQLNSLNSGDYEYGKISPDGEIYYKDIEFELFTTAILCRSGLKPNLPNHTEGNDIFCEDIEIQCKHPNVFNHNNIDKYIRKFHSSLVENNSYGIFAIALEDSFEYANLQSASTENDFETYLNQKRKDCDKILGEVFEKSLFDKARIIGVLLSASYYKLNLTSTSDFHFVRDTNSVFCFRPDRKEIKDNIYKKAYKILYTFNPSPTMLTIENGKIFVNNRGL